MRSSQRSGPKPVERLAGAIEHAAEQAWPGKRLEHLAAGNDASARRDVADLVRRDEQQRAAGEADDLGLRRAAVVVDDDAAAADRRFATFGFQRHAGHAPQHAMRGKAARRMCGGCAAQQAAPPSERARAAGSGNADIGYAAPDRAAATISAQRAVIVPSTSELPLARRKSPRPSSGRNRDLETLLGAAGQLCAHERGVLGIEVQRDVAHVRGQHGQAVGDRGVQHGRIVLDLAAHEMARELNCEADDLVLDGLLERLERMRERSDERLEARDARRDFGFAGRKSLLVAALPRLLFDLLLERLELPGREQVRAGFRRAAQGIRRRVIDRGKVPAARRRRRGSYR